ncbi:hypothetical protein [Actinoplanes aureus]|uniref:Uncharacterized protein n=1 Tax=Actinoplanes aureus TaxID=2792083 RepID=A0A931C2X3_9ACTN|nr:hypothetical protein [Actinoplanes aureus]MBG0560121.1 hypothetical protein [Actinoplanes aureus]
MIDEWATLTAGALVSLSGSVGLWMCVRQYIKARNEANRWKSVERLAERHGPEVLTVLPRLARELRDDTRRIDDASEKDEPQT